ncbi:diguanylate cyclase (GGDEF) domain-containing protein [Candidatus Magnetoovum chiemensis]|nr:diguanylate cyclase (GGDEF) domain-containing protein [Candidatus Magnetoovum chiemensis]
MEKSSKTDIHYTTKEDEDKFRSVLETSSDAVITLNNEGLVIYWNKAAESIFGYSFKEIFGKKLDLIIPPKLRASHGVAFLNVVKTGKSKLAGKNIELAGLRKDGAEFPIELSFAVWTIKENYFFTGIIRDISKRKQAQDNERKVYNEMNTLFDNIPLGLIYLDRDFTILRANKYICTMTSVSEKDLAGKKCYDVFGEYINNFSEKSGSKICRFCKVDECIATKKPAVFERPINGKFARITNVPQIDSSGEIIFFYEVIEDITNYKKAEDKLKLNYHTQKIISSILQISLEQITFQEQLDRILGNVLKLCSLELEPKGCIFLIDENSEKLILKSHSNLSEKQVKNCSEVSLGSCLCGTAALLKETVFLNDYKNHPTDFLCEEMTPHGHYCIPIKYKEDLLGVLTLYLKDGHVRDSSEEEILNAVANTIAGVIVRKKAEENVKLNYLIQQIVNSILQISLEKLSLDDYLDKSLKLILSVPWLSIESVGCIFLVDDESNNLYIAAQHGLSKALLEKCSALPLGRCLCGQAALNKEIVFADSIDHRHEIYFDGMTSHGHYCVPILSLDKALGVLNLYVKEGHKRTKFEDTVLTIIANTLSGVIERKRAEERLEYLANYDALTNIPNRTLLFDRINQEILHAQRYNQRFAVLYIDLDRFKCINDSLGHNMGDILLVETAKRLTECVRKTDTVARMSGDEFVIILKDISEVQDPAYVAKKIFAAMHRPFDLNSVKYSINVSIGISIYPNDGQDSSNLIKNADAALYHAKEDIGSNYRYYTNDMNSEIKERMKIENELRQAINEEEFVLYYQPQIDLRTGKIIGIEALIRWAHPISGFIPPSKFIPLAEETGLIVQIGEWVLQKACEQNSLWHKQGLNCLSVAVNMSLYQFIRQYNLMERVAQIIFEAELNPRLLELELTESICMENIDSTINTLREFNDMGIQLSIDDFGTGYSSLSYLKLLPFKKLKIDRSFIKDLNIRTDDYEIVKTIITMAHNLRLKVIAEGVETKEQLEVLRNLNCDEVQGYLFSKPIPPDEIELLFREDNMFTRDN